MRKITNTFLVISLCSASLPAIAQSEWKGWALASFTLSFSPKLDLRISQLRSYNLGNQVENGYNQTAANLNYDITKKLNILGGGLITTFPSDQEPTKRVFARLSYKMRIAGILNWSNGIQSEYHSVNETRYRYRFIYITRLSNRKEIPFLHLTLSATYWLYYNLGGNQIRYYDKVGAIVTHHSPDGLHRGRLYLTAASKVARGLTISMFYMRQNEFNLWSNEFRTINVLNPTTGKITRPFDFYNVAGLSVLYDINLYSSKVKKSSHHSPSNKK